VTGRHGSAIVGAAEVAAPERGYSDQPRDQGFGIVTTILLPGGVELLLYEPKHNSPLDL
jgi:hypothetical protein